MAKRSQTPAGFLEIASIQTEADAYRFMENLRWPDGPVCPHCGNTEKHWYLKPKGDDEARKTRTGSLSERRVWRCAECKRQFSVLTGTVFHGSKVPLKTWLMVVHEMCANRNGISAHEIRRKYHVGNKTAWYMAHRLREGMKLGAPDMLRGTIVADETFVGPKPGRMSAKRRQLYDAGREMDLNADKTPVLALIDAETGEVRSRVIADVTGHTLRKAIAEQVDMAGSVLHTDEWVSYQAIGREFQAHQTVNHSEGEYVRNGASTNKAESFFSQLKRSIDGTYHHVSVEHLPRYLDEFSFRSTTHKMTDEARVTRLMGQVGNRRISYKRIKGD